MDVRFVGVQSFSSARQKEVSVEVKYLRGMFSVGVIYLFCMCVDESKILAVDSSGVVNDGCRSPPPSMSKSS